VVRAIAKYDAVRVVELTGSPEDHLIVPTAERPPRVGDVGVVVNVATRLGGLGRHLTVRSSHADARTVWLAVFAAHELELVD
jgi:hypothetical protein